MNNFSWNIFNRIPIIGIMRNIPMVHMEILAKHYYEAGMSNLEVTMNSANAVEAISYLNKIFGEQLNIGAGTVCSLQDLEKALNAGAQFIVTPILNEEVIKKCVSAKIPIFPGALTPTEIYRAWDWGASMVKVFPATQFGPGYIKEVLAPLNTIKLVPTGGVTPENFTDFLKAGATGVGIGSNLFPSKFVENGQWEELKSFFTEIIKKYNDFKSKV